ncbi:hypothetical protein V2W45_1473230 [Cenococcum geophilum]
MPQPSPLTASDEYMRTRDAGIEVIRVTAGLHRQVWVSGTSIYVDMHIVNSSRKTIKKIELQLERDILCYKHAAASTMEKSASQARIFDSNERSILSKTTVKQGAAGWNGVAAHTTHLRTCDLELPLGHATIKCVPLTTLQSQPLTPPRKLVTVQLPIVLIHMGRAFAAPRMQSLERMRAHADDLHELADMLHCSPRKHPLRRVYSSFDYHTPPSNRKGRVLLGEDAAELKRRLRHAGVREDMELGALALGGESSFKARLEEARERQYQFGRKKSMKRWKWEKGGERDGWI